jgi:hypothetical protein
MLLPLQTQDHKVLPVRVHLTQLLHSSRLGIAQHMGGDLIDAPVRRVAFGAVLELDVDVLLFDAHGLILGRSPTNLLKNSYRRYGSLFEPGV